jgi:hypothetical protein
VSLFYQRSGRVSDINLTKTRQKVNYLLLSFTKLVLILTDGVRLIFLDQR